jgi:hypothetical protein
MVKIVIKPEFRLRKRERERNNDSSAGFSLRNIQELQALLPALYRCLSQEILHKQLFYSLLAAIRNKVFVPVMFFSDMIRFGKSAGIIFMDSAAVKVCRNKRINRNKVFNGIAKAGKNSPGRFYGFKLYLVCNDRFERKIY